MVIWVFKNLMSLLVLGVFATLVFAKTASHDGEDVLDGTGGGFGGFGGLGEEKEEDNKGGKEDNAERVYPPHMWKGMAFWIVLIYGIINLIMISRFFK